MVRNIKNLAIVTSPFQLLCLVEFFNKESLNKIEILVVLKKNDSNALEQIKKTIEILKPLIHIDDLEYFYLSRFWYINFIKTTKWLIQNRVNKYKYLLVGDLRDGIYSYIVNNVDHQSIVKIDDGFGTLNFHKHNNLKERIKKIFSLGTYNGIIKTEKIIFFTCFFEYIDDDRYELYENKFTFINNYLSKEIDIIDQNSFIGMPLVELNILSLNEYYSYIKKVSQLFEEGIVYYPHRRETEDKLKIINSIPNLNIQHLNMPIELYYLKNGIIDKNIYSFYSTALFTIQKIFDSKDINVGFIDLENEMEYTEPVRLTYNILNGTLNKLII